MSEKARRARTLSEEVREQADEGRTPGMPCAEGLYVCGCGEVEDVLGAAAAPRLLVCLSQTPPPQGVRQKADQIVHFALGAAAEILEYPDILLARLFACVGAARRQGGTAVVQCDLGQSRSVITAAAYLVYTGLAPREALLAVARSRPRVDFPLGAAALFDRVTKKVEGLNV